MTRNELEKYLGKRVEVKLFDNDIVTGFLRKTGDEAFRNDPNLYIPRNYYFLTSSVEGFITTSFLFRVSHIKSLKEVA